MEIFLFRKQARPIDLDLGLSPGQLALYMGYSTMSLLVQAQHYVTLVPSFMPSGFGDTIIRPCLVTSDFHFLHLPVKAPLVHLWT